ncbi:hypothetical protein M23134_01498 [Microscilla marina ATCC 23134]|uniref:Uncharacterized protein n=2 Tax=Microscilla marina TaxID=1027 RepID=A1ZJY5_MICM2|nr:hypothetical protein M23134_01498 [Microscilla marina ATCC 23134]
MLHFVQSKKMSTQEVQHLQTSIRQGILLAKEHRKDNGILSKEFLTNLLSKLAKNKALPGSSLALLPQLIDDFFQNPENKYVSPGEFLDKVKISLKRSQKQQLQDQNKQILK